MKWNQWYVLYECFYYFSINFFVYEIRRNDKQRWNTDKGQGYEKAYSYDKSNGLKKAHGNSGSKYTNNNSQDSGAKLKLKKYDQSGHDFKKNSNSNMNCKKNFK